MTTLLAPTHPSHEAEARRILALLPTDRAPTLDELVAAMAPPADGPYRYWVGYTIGDDDGGYWMALVEAVPGWRPIMAWVTAEEMPEIVRGPHSLVAVRTGGGERRVILRGEATGARDFLDGDAFFADVAEEQARPGPTEVWVFGCFGGDGHELYTAAGRRRLDTLAVPLDVERACDSSPPYQPSRETYAEHIARQVEGAIVRTRGPMPPGWSFVSWFDRQGDERYGSHTGILARGDWTEAELIAAGRRLAPWAFRVEVRL